VHRGLHSHLTQKWPTNGCEASLRQRIHQGHLGNRCARYGTRRATRTDSCNYYYSGIDLLSSWHSTRIFCSRDSWVAYGAALQVAVYTAAACTRTDDVSLEQTLYYMSVAAVFASCACGKCWKHTRHDRFFGWQKLKAPGLARPPSRASRPGSCQTTAAAHGVARSRDGRCCRRRQPHWWLAHPHPVARLPVALFATHPGDAKHAR